MFCDGECVEGAKVRIDDQETVSLTGAGTRDFFFEKCGHLIEQQ